MADNNESIHIVFCNAESTATVRSLQTMIEAYLGRALPRLGAVQTAVSIAIQNKHAGESLFIQTDPAGPNANIEVLAQQLRQYPAAGAFRYPLNEIFVRVNTNANPFTIEVVLE